MGDLYHTFSSLRIQLDDVVPCHLIVPTQLQSLICWHLTKHTISLTNQDFAVVVQWITSASMWKMLSHNLQDHLKLLVVCVVLYLHRS